MKVDPQALKAFPASVSTTAQALAECTLYGLAMGVSAQDYLRACVTAHVAQQQRIGDTTPGGAVGGLFVTQLANGLLLVDSFLGDREVMILTRSEFPLLARALQPLLAARGIAYPLSNLLPEGLVQ